MAYFIGLDCSTTATKALLVDEAGRVVAVTSAEYPYETPHPLWSEQDPALWWQATQTALRQLLSETAIPPTSIQAMGLTGQMHGLVLLDEAGEVIRPAILWNDQRTSAECDEIRARFGRNHLIETTGNDALTGFTAPKLLWVRQHEPAHFQRVAHILLPKDYVRYRLTGEFATDKADGAGTLLFDLAQRNWSAELLATLQINPTLLPHAYEGPEISGLVTHAAALATGLPVGLPIIAGAGDQAANAIGTGAVVNSIAALSLGTSGVVFATCDTPMREPEGRLHAFCHAIPDQWHLMGVMLSAAGSLRWYHDTFAPHQPYDELLKLAETAPIGCDGLTFLPYLTGERTPHPDPLARGAFVGLTVRHTQAHLIRAVLEGVGYGLRDNFALFAEMGVPIVEVRGSGGGLRSAVWRPILADVLNRPIITLNSDEGAAYGAAILAAVGAGLFSDVTTACQNWVKQSSQTNPSPHAEKYNDAYHRYRALYPALQPFFNGS